MNGSVNIEYKKSIHAIILKEILWVSLNDYTRKINK